MQVRELLKGEECIITESGRFRRPCEVYLRNRHVPAALLSNADLFAATSCEFARLDHGVDASGARRKEAAGMEGDGEASAGEGGGEGVREEEAVEALLKLGCRSVSGALVLGK